MKLMQNSTSDGNFKGFCDADWGNDTDNCYSITGYVMKQAGGPVAWNSRKQSTVALSTTETEYMAVSAVTQEAVWWKGFRQELLGCVEPVTIYCDNRSAIHLAEKQIGYSSRSKHIDIRHHFIRQSIARNLIQLKHVCSENQEADLLTKVLPISKFETAREAHGIKPILD